MAKQDISKQFDTCAKNANDIIEKYILVQMQNFCIYMVNKVLPNQQEFRNLTGNTITSFAFGIYINGTLRVMGFNKDSKPALRNKLIKGELVYDFEDYDGNNRRYFKADIDTNAGYGQTSSSQFLQSYKPTGKYSIIFTTGTEYSAYLENVLNLNVLSDGLETSRSQFIQSFKPIT